MEKVSEMTTEPIVGKFYLVPVITVNNDYEMPIIPIWHDDADIGVVAKHYHIDVRFVVDDRLEYSRTFDRETATLGQILTAEGVWCRVIEGSWVFARRKCRRRMPAMPRVKNFENVAKRHIGRKIVCGKCPHRGFPLESLPKDENGHVICNGHGLKIDMNKREVIER